MKDLFKNATYTIVTALLLLLVMPAAAAEFRKGADASSGRAYFVLDGEISPGDAKAFNELLHRDLYFLANARGVLVNSSGGDVLEAIKIAETVERVGLPIEVAVDGECSSACFFIYVAAPHRSAYGVVKIHAPYYNLAGVEAREYANYAQASRLVHESTRAFLLGRSVPSDLIEKMLSMSSTGAYSLTIDDRNRIGYESAFIREYGAQKCGGYRSDRLMTMEEVRRYRDCSEDFLVDARLSHIWGDKSHQAKVGLREVGLAFANRVQNSPTLSDAQKFAIQQDLSEIVTTSQPETWLERFDHYLKGIRL